jgi:hypothetical protein
MPTRIYDIAKKLGTESVVVLRKAKELGIAAAKVSSSSLDRVTAEYLEDHVKSQLTASNPQQVVEDSIKPVTVASAIPLGQPHSPVYRDGSTACPATFSREVEMFEGGNGIGISGECQLAVYRLTDTGFETVGSFLLRVISENTKADADRDLAQVEVIANPESNSLEFKPSVKFDIYQKQENAGLARSVVKTVAAFLNSDGGALLIGVADSGQVVGLEKDIATFQRRNRDQLEQFLHSLILDRLGPGLNSCIQIRFHQVGDKEVCVIRVRRSHRPVFLREGSEEVFYLRTGNASKRLNMSAAVEYCRQIWPGSPSG